MKIITMAMASSSLPPLAMVRPGRVSFSHAHRLQSTQWKWSCCPCSLQSRDHTKFQVAASRRNRPLSSSKTKKAQKNEENEDLLDEDALEALFSQLEKDLEKNQLSEDDDDEDDMITEEEVSKFEKELNEALSDVEDNEEAWEEYPPLKLENWQLQKLAAALDVGRRKVSVKMLTAELGLDREIVLDLLRNPPPELLLIQPVEDNTGSTQSAIKPAKDNVESSGSDSKPVDPTSKEASKNEAEVPIYVNQMGWNRKKRMKKTQIATLEKVYRRTRRPTDAMVDNIIHLTNLPRKAIVKWFSDKRMQESPKVVYKKHQ